MSCRATLGVFITAQLTFYLEGFILLTVKVFENCFFSVYVGIIMCVHVAFECEVNYVKTFEVKFILNCKLLFKLLQQRQRLMCMLCI